MLLRCLDQAQLILYNPTAGRKLPSKEKRRRAPFQLRRSVPASLRRRSIPRTLSTWLCSPPQWRAGAMTPDRVGHLHKNLLKKLESPKIFPFTALGAQMSSPRQKLF